MQLSMRIHTSLSFLTSRGLHTHLRKFYRRPHMFSRLPTSHRQRMVRIPHPFRATLHFLCSSRRPKASRPAERSRRPLMFRNPNTFHCLHSSHLLRMFRSIGMCHLRTIHRRNTIHLSYNSPSLRSSHGFNMFLRDRLSRPPETSPHHTFRSLHTYCRFPTTLPL